MTVDLADFVNGTPGRFVPAQMRGELVEVQHLARYAWATALAPGRRVLDAGCGLGYGAAMLADAGAESVTAVDVAAEIVDVARDQAGDHVTFEVADLRSLPFGDAAFDLVVCFEVIEHIEEQETALDELRRVLAPGGVLVVSSPNPDVNVPGNPHHVRELTPGDLESLLGARWNAVQILQQYDFEASVVLTADAVADGARVAPAEVRKLAAGNAGRQPYSIAIAGDSVPEVGNLVMLTSSFEVRDWVERFDAQQSMLQEQADFLAATQRKQLDIDDLRKRLVEAETALAEVPTLHQRVRTAESALHDLAGRLEEEAARAERAQRVVHDLQTSISWRLTQPLRRAKRLLGR
ncbi:class I SAM-dependent methyltransferase [Solirubrobacter sp. CPCC 204708]|uniref:Class I SAM-dependent methyltransferase n=1 Tax=Solirubrobacter deserti TaxID=2282478 RepID=A0ABT4RN57_9ACTN|nr:class I SAM-dependent methyltransferase [Solirubrobacter deserti]MBE2317421.1 class I SAM-dependent methyltransferase [Solirubrobacter deserti]MDA0140003.1 class I SAM-dependent methyltransferase [Solirubrobacter deserti]